MPITYRIATMDDLRTITDLSLLMQTGEYCGEDTEEDLIRWITKGLQYPEMEIFLAFDGDKAVGFSHVLIRHEWFWSENQEGPVGYLDIIFMHPDYRRQGIAETLVKMCEDWSRERDCIEFASSCDLENEVSFAFHTGIGFREIHRIIHFTKEL